ncbi:MAG TPA: hypothetical protein VGV14_14895, partial [Rhodanobacter sp.]|nr:hypothetical protein [Rhodanobacter sp.]
SGCIAELKRCGWGKLLIDNALVHLAYDVVGRIRSTVGCALNFGPVRRFERRPIVELIFRQLCRAGFHRVPSTTGSNSLDPLRMDAEAKAAKHRMTMAAVLDLIEAVIADYNTKPGKANFGVGGLDYLRSVIDDEALGFITPVIPRPLPHEPPLDIELETGRIGGSQKKGVRPHIYLDGVAYTNPELANRWCLIGRKVRMHVDADNIQAFQAYLEDGSPLGVVHAQGRWAHTPHSREARRQINAMIRTGDLRLSKADDPVVMWLQLLAQQAVEHGGRDDRPKITREGTQLAEEMRRCHVSVSAIDVPVDRAGKALRVLPASDVAKRTSLTLPIDVKAWN